MPPVRHVLPSMLLPLALAAPLPALETRTVRLELKPSGPFAVENLAGSMRIKPGSSGAVVAVATLSAESAEVLAAMRFEQVKGPDGVPTLRVRYPTGKYHPVRFARGEASGREEHWLEKLFGGSRSNLKYDGERVTVSGDDGVEMHAAVEVELPKLALEGRFANYIGGLRAEAVEGRLTFDTASGDIALKSLKGEIAADTGSGDIALDGGTGSFDGDTGSGDCAVSGFHGGGISCDTGSGDVRVRSSKGGTVKLSTGSGAVAADALEAESLDVSTGSGDVRLKAVIARRLDAGTGSGDIEAAASDLRQVKADTGSGDVVLEARDGTLESVQVDTGSGDVTLRLGAKASFVAHADLSSGRVSTLFSDARPILDGKEVVGYRRGDGRTRIDVDTGSGDLRLEE